jgi:hypothetical protein
MRNAKKTLSLVMVAIFTTFIVLSGIPVMAAKKVVVSAAAKAQTTRATYYVVKAETVASTATVTAAKNQYAVAVKEVRALHTFGNQVAAAYASLSARVVSVNKIIAARNTVNPDVAAAEKLVNTAEDLTNTDTYDLVGSDTDLANAQNAVTDALEGIVKLDKDSSQYKGLMARVDAANAKIISAMDTIQEAADQAAQDKAVVDAKAAVAKVVAASIVTEADVAAVAADQAAAVTAVAAVTDAAVAKDLNDQLQAVADKIAAIKAPAKVVTVSAVDGTISVTFDKNTVTTPAAVDFAVTSSINGATATSVTPGAVNVTSGNTVTITVPAIPQTSADQNVVYSVKYTTGQAISAAAYTVAKIPALAITSMKSTGLAEMVINFNTAVDPASVDVANIKVDGIALDSNVDDSATLSTDGLTLTVFKKAGFSNQQETHKISVSGMKSLNGASTMTAVIDQDVKFTDLALPQLVSVTATGNQKLVLQFNEPINPTNLASDIYSNYRIDGNLLIGDATQSISVLDRTVTIYLGTPLAAGNHTLNFVNNTITDYAGFGCVPNDTTFSVVADLAPATVSVVSADNTNLVLKFNKEIKSTDVYWMDGLVKRSATVTKDTTDVTKMNAVFSNANALPLYATTVYVENATDYSGNITPKTALTVTAIADITRPTVLSVIPEDKYQESKMDVTFSENVLDTSANLYGSVIVKDKDGNVVATTASYKLAADNTAIKTVLVLAGTFSSAAAPYTVTIQNVSDLSYYANKSLQQSFTITTPDVTAPILGGAQRLTGSNDIIISYNEVMNPSSITALSNYSYESSPGVYSALPSGTTIALANSGKSVTITFPLSWTLPSGATTTRAAFGLTGKKIMISNAADVAGNTVGLSLATITDVAAEATITITGANATGTNTIELPYTAGALPVVVYAGDFTATAGLVNLGVTGATLDTVNNKIILTTSLAMNADGTYGLTNAPITVGMVASPAATKTALGTALAMVPVVGINDEIKGTIVIPDTLGALAVSSLGGVPTNKVTIGFNEIMKAIVSGSPAANAFTVRDANGNLLTEGAAADYTITATGADNNVTLTLLKTYSGILTVALTNNTTVLDANLNKVNDFTAVQTATAVIK